MSRRPYPARCRAYPSLNALDEPRIYWYTNLLVYLRLLSGGKEMAPEKNPPRQRERDKTDVSRHASGVKTGEPRRDSELASEHQADLDRDAERAEADKAKLQGRSDSDASRDL